MDKLVIKGGLALNGEINISGAKNSALPIFAATLLTNDEMIIGNIPHLHDITTTMQLLGDMGSDLMLNEYTRVTINNSNLKSFNAPYDLVKTMRASILVLGPLLSRYGEAKVSLPGGCAIGARPVTLHLEGLAAMGADIRVEDGYIHARSKRLKGNHFNMALVTVTGTENLMMAATLAEGETVIDNAACEPEVADLAECLNKMGANISGAGTKKIVIEGVDELKGAAHDILPDRIETGTYMVAAVMTKGHVKLKKTRPELLEIVIDKVKEAGADLEIEEHAITVDMRDKNIQPVNIQTDPFPGFPTDMQAQFTAMNCVADGEGTIVENIFENRFMHIPELQRMGAQIKLDGNTVKTSGIERLSPASLVATDLRASASLVLAGLIADGETIIHEIYHIDRGYETIEEKFCQLGAKIQRCSSDDEKIIKY